MITYPNFYVLTASESPHLYGSKQKLEEEFARQGLWPKFITKGTVSKEYSPFLDEFFLEYQFLLVQEHHEDNVIGVGSSIPLFWDFNTEPLPDKGWDWALSKGVEDFRAQTPPNVLCGLSITVAQSYQGKGLGGMLIEAMLSKCDRKHFGRLIVPVRPTKKANYPKTLMLDYIKWKREDGLLFDPWLRAHKRLGGQIVSVCTNSMTIVGTIEEWENWTGMKFSQSSEYVIKGGLVPLQVSLETDRGIYIEPNVWVEYRI